MSPEERVSVPKLLGADVELGNFILGREGRYGTGDDAARALLAELPGVLAIRSSHYGSWSGGYSYGSYGGYGVGWNAQDRDRRFLRENGGAAYIDLAHFEACLPEVRKASDFVAAYHAMLRLTRGAQVRAQAELDEGESLKVVINNSDGMGHSYGSHLNFMISRQLWDDLITRRPHYLGFLAAHQVSSIVYTGQGKVGSENGQAPVDFQLSQRADFFELLCAEQTTHTRPIVNSRDEALCGKRDDDLARLHHIFSDAGLAHVATFLKVGTMQLVLAMLEAGDVDLRLLLDDPVAAVVAISHDPTLVERVPLACGASSTAIEIQTGMLECALRHGDRTGFPTVPEADRILEVWEDTLELLDTRELAAVSDRLDWALKLELLEEARGDGLAWDAPELKVLDWLYASLDPEEGLYFACEAAGDVERIVSDEAIEHFTHEPPSDTRAWTRAMLLRRFDDEDIARVDWDRVAIDTNGEDGRRRSYVLQLDDPCAFTRADSQHLFNTGAAPAAPSTGDVVPFERSHS